MEVAPVMSTSPFRLRTKGPDYFRRPEIPGASRPSAVERLEADKAKYVKSHQVMRTKQEPVCAPTTPTLEPARTMCPQTTLSRPVLTHKQARKTSTPPLSVAISPKTTPVRQLVQPSRPSGVATRRLLTPPALPQAIPRKTQRPETRCESVLNLETLSNLINVSDAPPPSSTLTLNKSSTNAGSESPSSIPVSLLAITEPNCGPLLSPSGVAVRRVDVRPPAMQGSPLRAQIRMLQRPQPRGPSVLSPPPASPVSTCSLQRSKSDLSDRFSRAPADLERFFNYCGLDPSYMEGLAWTGSDITSLSRLRSASAPGSEHGGPSQGSDRELDEQAASTSRVPYGVSVIERNARVIKWLYGLRQAWAM